MRQLPSVISITYRINKTDKKESVESGIEKVEVLSSRSLRHMHRKGGLLCSHPDPVPRLSIAQV